MDVNMVHLSESTSGTGIAVAATSTPGTLIHTAVAGAVIFDRLFLWAFCNHTEARVLTLEMGGVDDPEDTVVMTIPINVGDVQVCGGSRVLNGGLLVRAFTTTTTDVIGVSGYVLRYS